MNYNQFCAMMGNDVKEKNVRSDEPVQLPKRKKFQGFSMGFLLLLLAVVVGVYIVCTILAG